uniref:Uncharacterized protein n=1 Tax=Romanomermis culicivorax TaxID=13658 RepID=A0A915L0L9_ROMCU
MKGSSRCETYIKTCKIRVADAKAEEKWMKVTQHSAMSTSRIKASDLAKIIELLIEQQKAQREEQKL